MTDQNAERPQDEKPENWFARNRLWAYAFAILLASLAIGVHLYRPGLVVEFGDTVFPLHAYDELIQWSEWWTTNELGAVWLNPSWLPVLFWPSIGERFVAPGFVEALEYGFWLGLPALVLAYCLHIVSPRKAQVWMLPALLLAAFNMRVVTQFGGSLEIYTYVGALLVTAAIFDALIKGRVRRSLAWIALAALVLAPDAANPPYIGIVFLHACAVTLWICRAYRVTLASIAKFFGLALCVAAAVSLRWIVPFIHTLSAYPLTSEGSGAGADYSWVNASASVSNILRDVPVWFWLDPAYGTLATAYSHNALLKLLIMAPFAAFFLSVSWLAWTRSVLGLGVSLLTFAWWFLAKGAHPPFSDLSRAIGHLPLMWLFRDAEKFLIPANICAALAIGVALSAQDTPRRVRVGVSTLAVLGALGALWPLATGAVFTSPHATPNPYVSVPSSYLTLRDLVSIPKDCRVVVLPWDRFYEVGYNWGFYGDDTNFVDQMVGAPVVHQAYLGYVQNPYAVQFAGMYDEALKSDGVAQEQIEDLYLIGAAVSRRDLQPGIGTDPTPPREADALSAYRAVKSDEHLGVFTRRCDPAGMTRWFARALRVPSGRTEGVEGLIDAGLASEILPVSTESKVDNVDNLESRATPWAVPRRADSIAQGETGRATFQHGSYELVVRGLPMEKMQLRFDAASQATDGDTAPIYGVNSAIAARAPDGRAAVQTFQFLNESQRFAKAKVQLRLQASESVSCFDLNINGVESGKIKIPFGRHSVTIYAVFQPAANSMTVTSASSCTGALVPPIEDDRWGAIGIPNSVIGTLTRRASKARVVTTRDGRIEISGASEVSTAGFHVGAPRVASDPIATLAFVRNDAGTAQVMLRADVTGAGCKTRILAVADPAASVVNLDLRAALSEAARRQFLPNACGRAKMKNLRIAGLDALVVFPAHSSTSSVSLSDVTIVARRGVYGVDSGNLRVSIGGHVYEAPADDVPHRFAVGTLSGPTRIATAGPLREGFLIDRALLARGQPLGGGFRGFHGTVRKGWVLYNQSPERDWRAAQAGSQITPIVAWGTLQAYPVEEGHVDIAMPFTRLRIPLEIFSWMAFVCVLLVGFLPWKRRAR